MDYEFFFDPIDGRPIAKVSEPQSAFGTWLTEEIGNNSKQIDAILQQLSDPIADWREHGREWTVERDGDAILLAHHSMTTADEMPLSGEDDIRDDYQSLSAEAGPEDFEKLITAWFHHISS
ncbi:YacL family protein [Neiella sp. HB171785]|uniref:YacL family protein n=1 Tax=Neiella litorisoli TaxID=2771431 RepID=A0A8J6QRU5_9GAMM|nr:YacL family protein [Neiella litorisoli]MBD1390651.1 YacL family protein [Neiella litorisoli]